MKKQRVLFIGNFLSRHKGTKGNSEKLFISETLNNYIEFYTASNKANKVIRLFDMLVQTLIFRGDQVHIDVFSGPAFLYARVVSRIAIFRGKRVLMTLRGGALPEYYELKTVQFNSTLLRAHKILTPSKFLQEYFEDKGYNIHYIPNSIDSNKFPFNRDDIKPYSLLWVRAFSKIYNSDVPVRVLYELRKKFPDASLTMVGPDKGTLAEIRTLIKQLNVEERVQITGPIQNEELKVFYQSHHVYLNTTSFESFGVAVLEAASSGMPIVSNSVGEIPLIWKEGESILMVENNDIFEFCKHIEYLFTDKNLCESLSQSARENSQKFDRTLIEQEWVNVLTNSD